MVEALIEASRKGALRLPSHTLDAAYRDCGVAPDNLAGPVVGGSF
jgi:hypothetical protein